MTKERIEELKKRCRPGWSIAHMRDCLWECIQAIECERGKRDEMVRALEFLSRQTERLAECAFSDPKATKQWLAKCDALNCAKQAIARAEG